MKGTLATTATVRVSHFCPHPLPFRFHATLYQCPETANERAEMSVAVSNRINDLMTVLRTTEDHSITQLQEIALELDTWKTKVYTYICALSRVCDVGGHVMCIYYCPLVTIAVLCR